MNVASLEHPAVVLSHIPNIDDTSCAPGYCNVINSYFHCDLRFSDFCITGGQEPLRNQNYIYTLVIFLHELVYIDIIEE